MKILNFEDKKIKDYLSKYSTDYDLVIIGSGFASYALAKKTLNKKKNLVIEKGGFNSNNIPKNKLINKGNINLKSETINEGIGGASNSWSGNLCQYTNIEFKDKQTNKT